ncbi:expressed unknown protein [Seminavis robusta]|uniref:Uncharacterized protein n=1 Tax=Seminavis robusta TaxID=568900 RepID=A0A9N8E4V4_9STRA|nr:expressed unknown protein [Seminavis robusta]|eukprot:Sro522_g159520.1 n/a (287) ;mRNA; f:3610-4470
MRTLVLRYLVLSTSVLVLTESTTAPPPTPAPSPPLSDTICDDLLNYTYHGIYNSSKMEDSFACECFRDPLNPVYALSCMFDYCEQCRPWMDGALCIIKQDLLIFDANILEPAAAGPRTESLMEQATVEIFYRNYFNDTLGYYDYQYTELTLGQSPSTHQCTVNVNQVAVPDGDQICTCGVHDCHNDGTITYSFDCPNYPLAGGNDVRFGNCNGVGDTRSPDKIRIHDPLVAMLFDFTSCFQEVPSPAPSVSPAPSNVPTVTRRRELEEDGRQQLQQTDTKLGNLRS